MTKENIHKGDKKKINVLIYIFFLFYMVLPDYFALEVSESFPLITASRFILLFCFFFIIVKRHGKLSITAIKLLDKNTKCYFALFFIVNTIHIFDNGVSAVSRLFVIILEQICVVWLISMLVNTRKKFDKAIEMLMYASIIVAVISIVGFIFDTNLFYLLTTVTREMTKAGTTDIGYRNGLLRVEAGFGHPVYYGLYCSIMIFVSLYFYNYKNKKISSIISLLLNVVALLLTNSRGSILAIAVTLIISFFINGWEERKKYLKLIIFFIIFIAIAFVLSSRIRNYIMTVIKSFYVYFGLSDGVMSNYGANMSFANDRLMQFSGIIWTLKNAALIGFGYGSQTGGLIKYQYLGSWYPAISFDVGYVEIVCCYGIIGAIAWLFLLRAIIKNLKEIKRKPYWIMFRNIFIVYMLCMLSVVSIDKIFWVLFGLLLTYGKILKREKNSSEKIKVD